MWLLEQNLVLLSWPLPGPTSLHKLPREWGGGWVTPPESKPILYPTLCYLPSSLPLNLVLGCAELQCAWGGGGTKQAQSREF